MKKKVFILLAVKLNRADVEWLLATHENGRGPVIWSDETQRERIGLDLRGADLAKSTQSYEDPLYKALPIFRDNLIAT